MYFESMYLRSSVQFFWSTLELIISEVFVHFRINVNIEVIFHSGDV